MEQLRKSQEKHMQVDLLRNTYCLNDQFFSHGDACKDTMLVYCTTSSSPSKKNFEQEIKKEIFEVSMKCEVPPLIPRYNPAQYTNIQEWCICTKDKDRRFFRLLLSSMDCICFPDDAETESDIGYKTKYTNPDYSPCIYLTKKRKYCELNNRIFDRNGKIVCKPINEPLPLEDKMKCNDLDYEQLIKNYEKSKDDVKEYERFYKKIQSQNEIFKNQSQIIGSKRNNETYDSMTVSNPMIPSTIHASARPYTNISPSAFDTMQNKMMTPSGNQNILIVFVGLLPFILIIYLFSLFQKPIGRKIKKLRPLKEKIKRKKNNETSNETCEKTHVNQAQPKIAEAIEEKSKKIKKKYLPSDLHSTSKEEEYLSLLDNEEAQE